MDKRTKEYKQWKANFEKSPPKGIQGAGDIVKAVTKYTGLQKIFDEFGIDCDCEERQEKLNKALPVRLKPRCLTEKEYNDWKAFREVRTLTLSNNQVVFISRTFADVFNMHYQEPCRGCKPTKIISWINNIDKVFETYQ